MTGPLIALLIAVAIVVALHVGAREPPPADPTVWHRWWSATPVRLADGRWSRSVGQLWRRRTATGWEYQQDAETPAEFEERAW